MKQIFSIPLYEEVNYYLLFYLFSFSIAFLIVFSKCLKNRKELQFLSVITAAIFLAFVFGCKLATFVEEILISSPQQHGLYQVTQMGLGGVALSFLLVVLLRKLFHIPGEYLYGLGYAILLGLMLQKPGCLLAGCCRGFEGSLLFNITYLDGVIRLPLQLYEMGFYLIALLALRKIRVRKLASKYFIAVALFCVVQFLAEFMKDPLYTLVVAERISGLKMIQWIYLSFALISFTFYYMSESKKSAGYSLIYNPKVATNCILLLAIVITFFFIHPFLFRLEIYAINLALIPAMVLAAYGIFKQITIPRYRWASLLIMILPLFLMSQTVPVKTAKQQVFRTIGLGYHGGKFTNHIVNDTDPGDCYNPSYPNDFEQKYNLLSIGFSTTKIREKGQFSYGINASFGGITETDLTTNESTDGTILSLNPYIMYDLNWFGIGAGLHIGSNYYALPKSFYEDNGMPETGLGTFPVLPQAYVRVGPKRFFALEYNFANHFPSALPAFTHEIVLGSGFGFKNGFYIKYGIPFGSQAYAEYISYVSGYIPIANKVVVEPLIGLGSMKNVYMLGLSYRFGHKETEYTISNSNDN